MTSNNIKRIFGSTIACVLLIIIFGNIYRESRYVKQGEVKDYVFSNQELLNSFVFSLYQNQVDNLFIYRKASDLPEIVDSSKIYSKLRIDRIVSYKECYDSEDCVKIYLLYKPKSQDYYTCGIYYSQNNETLDFYGDIQIGDSYEYDGTPNGTKIKYKSEKICDYWYYFEESVWN